MNIGQVNHNQPAFKTSRVPVSGRKTPDDVYSKIHSLFQRMFGIEIPAEIQGRLEGFVEGLKRLEAEGGGFITGKTGGWFTNKIKKFLASVLYGKDGGDRWRDISDDFIKWFLGDNLKITVTGLYERLKEYLPQIMALNAQQNGAGAWAMLTGEIRYVNFDKMAGYAQNFDFSKPAISSILSAVSRAYVMVPESRAERESRAKEVQDILENKQFGRMPHDLIKLLLVGVQSAFRAQCVKHGVSYDNDALKDPDLLQKYTAGILRQWIETGVLPESVDKSSINKVFLSYQPDTFKTSVKTPKTPISRPH